MKSGWIVVRNTEPLNPSYLKPWGGWTKNCNEARMFKSKADVLEAVNKARFANPAERINFCRHNRQTDTRHW